MLYTPLPVVHDAEAEPLCAEVTCLGHTAEKMLTNPCADLPSPSVRLLASCCASRHPVLVGRAAGPGALLNSLPLQGRGEARAASTLAVNEDLDILLID